MNIDIKRKKSLVEELELLSNKIEETNDFFAANFYFSAAYRAFDKILRTDYDKSILFSEEILQMAYLRTTSLVQDNNLQKVIGQEMIMKTMKEIAHKTKELALNIQNGLDGMEALSEIIELAYTLTGPGKYLKDMGKIKK